MTITHEEHARPDALRAAIRRGTWTGPTAGLAPGCAQANLVALPASDALDFLRFCVHNPQPCPVLEVTDPGSPEPVHTALDGRRGQRNAGADLGERRARIGDQQRNDSLVNGVHLQRSGPHAQDSSLFRTPPCYLPFSSWIPGNACRETGHI